MLQDDESAEHSLLALALQSSEVGRKFEYGKITLGYGHELLQRETHVPDMEPAEEAQNWQLPSERHAEQLWPLYTEQSLQVVLKVHGIAETGAGHAVPKYGMHVPVARLVPQNWQEAPELLAQAEHGVPSALQVAASFVALQASEFFQ